MEICLFIISLLVGLNIALILTKDSAETTKNCSRWQKILGKARVLLSEKNKTRKQRIFLKTIQSILLVITIGGVLYYTFTAMDSADGRLSDVKLIMMLIMMTIAYFVAITLIWLLVITPKKFLLFFFIEEVLEDTFYCSHKTCRTIAVIHNSITLCILPILVIILYNKGLETFLSIAISMIITIGASTFITLAFGLLYIIGKMITKIVKSYLQWLLR